MQGTTVWMLNLLLIHVKRVDGAGDVPRPVIKGDGAATKPVMKSAGERRLLSATQPFSGGQRSERYWISAEARSGRPPSWSARGDAMAACKEQDIEDDTIEQPESVGSEVPPAREADRMANPGEPIWPEADRSCSAVQRVIGDGFSIRNESRPGVLCRVQYNRR